MSATPATDELRRAAYRVADAARQVEALIVHTPASATAWADLRWAHAHLSAVLRLAPDTPDEAAGSPMAETSERTTPTVQRDPSVHVSALQDAGWLRLEVKSPRRWVPPGSDGSRADRMTQTEALAALRAQAGQARQAAGMPRDAVPAGRHTPAREGT
ncbi:hypothetical protein AB0I85_28500 [Micromonospora echinofusca]|uniref:hypothetical protein n=1 Tax=Micromonospora echinofusca TaxID=47858 RepID=UPI0033F1701E